MAAGAKTTQMAMEAEVATNCSIRSVFAGLLAMSVQASVSPMIEWRASLVPAAAVIPAPWAYLNAVAVKKLVVQPEARVVSSQKVPTAHKWWRSVNSVC